MRLFAVLLFLCTSLGAPAFAETQADACALLTRAEVSRVQREPVTETTSSKRERKGFQVFQCFYTAKTFEKSVSLEVTRPDTASATAINPRQDWKQIFHSPQSAVERDKPTKAGESAATGNGKKKEAKSGSPVPIKGVGEEAFWVSDAVAGALYVLKGDSYFRLSIGGWADQPQRLGKTKELARRILKRL